MTGQFKETLDVRGLSCPLPLVKTKQAMDRGAGVIEVRGDTPAAKDNITRLARSRHYDVAEEGPAGGEWTLILTLRSR
ncbi:MAG: sulfurtransferase TusA family protein [Clostridia bacterium]|jgi:tRNA 2-thiouridine synthesizing protein A|nr:sulfurtransferase TusA family protein [Clostridia bacterium]MDH7572619.1 sulfurtransferase TusA family protein [Clostridia bacterium]